PPAHPLPSSPSVTTGVPELTGEPLGLLDYEEPPDAYGVDDCEVLFKDPHVVFTYWEVTQAGVAAARAQLGPSAEAARLVLRLYFTDGGGRELHDFDLNMGCLGRRYLQTPRSGGQVRVAVGLLSQEGYFAPIAHSSLMRLPPSGPAPTMATEWLEVEPLRTRGLTREAWLLRRAPKGERALPYRLWPS